MDEAIALSEELERLQSIARQKECDSKLSFRDIGQ